MIRAAGVSKFYGANRALGPVSFTIEKGETVGFLGLNGAGKTTALRVLAGDLRPSGGSISIGDVDLVANPGAVRTRIGFLPETPPLYEEMTIRKYLMFVGKLRGMDKTELGNRLPKVLHTTGLSDVASMLIAHLSSGYRQRVGVAQAILHNPTLLILDEPTRSLDPVQIVDMREMIASLKKDHTVLISSHILTEISKTCDRLLVLNKGEILAQGTQEEISEIFGPLKQDGQSAIELTVDLSESDGDADKLSSLLSKVEDVVSVNIKDSHGVATANITALGDIRPSLAKAAVEGGFGLMTLGLRAQDHSLEQAFVELVKEGGDSANN